jgi:hypothetical protein
LQTHLDTNGANAMTGSEIERFFFKPAPASAAELAGQRRQSSQGFQAPPARPEKAPYHLDLAAVLPTRTDAIRQAGRIVFHALGDTGGINGPGAQRNVADHMTAQVHATALPDQPSFFFHLGDVVYYHGEESQYHDQFYGPYQDYPAPIFAIPGNHDGDVGGAPHRSLVPFMDHFCSREAHHAVEAGHSDRPTMIQPNCYWRLEAPFVTVLGLYSNVTGELDNTDAGATAQRDWLTEELRTAPTDRCLLVAVHHPIYSVGPHGPTPRVAEALEVAVRTAGRRPDAVLSGHDHNYQRFTRRVEGRDVPFLVVGAGGFAGYELSKVHRRLALPDGVTLDHSNAKRPGFLRLTVSPDRLVGEYFTVPEEGHEGEDAELDDRFTLDLRQHRQS